MIPCHPAPVPRRGEPRRIEDDIERVILEAIDSRGLRAEAAHKLGVSQKAVINRLYVDDAPPTPGAKRRERRELRLAEATKLCDLLGWSLEISTVQRRVIASSARGSPRDRRQAS